MKGGIEMLKKCILSMGAVLLLTSAGFAAVGHTVGHSLFATHHATIVGHGPIVHPYYYCGAIGFQQQTFIIGCQYPVIHRFCWWPCEPPWKPPCNPPCGPPSNPSYFVKGGDATATATSYNGSADPTAQAIGGDATLVIKCKPLCNPSCIAKGGDASATATSYGGSADTIAHAVGGDAIVIIK
jgi:hypothetical protein